jgi:NO-binding membrane sensor protein with MHYT domain
MSIPASINASPLVTGSRSLTAKISLTFGYFFAIEMKQRVQQSIDEDRTNVFLVGGIVCAIAIHATCFTVFER